MLINCLQERGKTDRFSSDMLKAFDDIDWEVRGDLLEQAAAWKEEQAGSSEDNRP